MIIFATTGIQFMQINTLYQLLSMRMSQDPQLVHADKLLLVPDLLHHGCRAWQSPNTPTLRPPKCLIAIAAIWRTRYAGAPDIPRHDFAQGDYAGYDFGSR
jgi:rhamnulokinase